MTLAETAGQPSAPAGATVERFPRRLAYLHPGSIIASADPCTVTTILGSCVAVCLWDVRQGIGGVNHFLLPHGPAGGAEERFGDTATERLVASLRGLGARRLVAKLFGGACVLEAFRGHREHLGARNVAAARRVLAAREVPVFLEDVGGDRGRKLVFQTEDGSAFVRSL